MTPWRFRIWEEGRFVDAWTMNHLFGGALLGWIVVMAQFPLTTGTFLSIGILIGWETFEIFRGIHEYVLNRWFDVLIGIFGFFFIVDFLGRASLSNKLPGLLLLTLTFTILDVWGYLAYRRRLRFSSGKNHLHS